MCFTQFLGPGNIGMNKKNSPSSLGNHTLVEGHKQYDKNSMAYVYCYLFIT